MEIKRPYCLKWANVVFLKRSASGPDAFFSKAVVSVEADVGVTAQKKEEEFVTLVEC